LESIRWLEAGPQLQATGHFRAEKHAGKWWLVDPSGRLFWSHGIDCVRPRMRRHPSRIACSALRFARQGVAAVTVFMPRSLAPHGYYQDKGTFDTFNFTGANLFRSTELAGVPSSTTCAIDDCAAGAQHDRQLVGSGNLRPCADTLRGHRWFRAQAIEGSSGYWGKFPDPFDPDFAATVRRNVSGQKEMAGSAWCLGVFIDNELAWATSFRWLWPRWPHRHSNERSKSSSRC